MNHLKKLYEAFVEDFNYFGTPTGSEKQITSLYVDPFCANSKFASSDVCFSLKQKLTEELFPTYKLCSQRVHSSCENKNCKDYIKFKNTENYFFLILSGSGTGKTTCALNLAKFYWEKVIKFHFRSIKFRFNLIKNDINVIPIYIYLPSVKEIENWREVLQSYLHTKGIGSDAYNYISMRKKVLLILDGYDEIASAYDATGNSIL